MERTGESKFPVTITQQHFNKYYIKYFINISSKIKKLRNKDQKKSMCKFENWPSKDLGEIVLQKGITKEQ